MKGLKGLTFGTINKGRENPVLVQRAKLVRRLEQQKALALDPTYTLTVQKWVKTEEGGKELRTLRKRVSPWWREDVLGNIALTVRAGGRAVEFEGQDGNRCARHGSVCADDRDGHCSLACR
jgi:hypothetical protein